MKRTRLVFRELKNYKFILKTVKAAKRDITSEWHRLNLRSDWIGRIYTVVSLREEDMGEEEVVQNFKAMQMMKPMNDYLTSLDLSEVLFPSIEKIPDSRSYLIVYSPLFKEVTVGWLVSRFLLSIGSLIGLFYLIHHSLK